MDISWNNNEQQARFLQLWEREPSIARRHTKEVWDVRAESWESGLREDAGRRQRSERRIAATEAALTRGISREEIECFLATVEKLKANLM